MRNAHLRRAGAVVGTAALLAAATVGVSGSPANAATKSVTVEYACSSTYFGVAFLDHQTVDVTLTAPDTVQHGTEIEVTVELDSGVLSPPVPLDDVVVTPTVIVNGQDRLGGPIAEATGGGDPSASADVPARGEYPTGGPATVLVPTIDLAVTNQVDLRPDTLTLSIASADGNGLVSCVPETAPPAGPRVFISGPPAPTPVSECIAVPIAGCDTNQEILAAVEPGALAQEATTTAPNLSATVVDFGSTGVASTEQVLTAPLNSITVTDARGGALSWSLTASMTDFTTAGTATMSASTVSISPSCSAVEAGSAPGAEAGEAGQSFGGTPVVLCVGPTDTDYESDSTSGQWVVDAPMTLTVPQFQGAGNYSAILTVTLV